jgi:hypothetical protein
LHQRFLLHTKAGFLGALTLFSVAKHTFFSDALICFIHGASKPLFLCQSLLFLLSDTLGIKFCQNSRFDRRLQTNLLNGTGFRLFFGPTAKLLFGSTTHFFIHTSTHFLLRLTASVLRCAKNCLLLCF